MNLSHEFTVEFLKYLQILSFYIILLNLWTEVLAHDILKLVPISCVHIVLVIEMSLLQDILMLVKLID